MLLSRNRAFTREPSRIGQAKSFYIFCEGVKRERHCMLGTKKEAPKYEYQKNDEVWLIFDTDPDKLDSREPQIAAIREFCKKVKGQQWFAAESNPCFEVWLYYHKQAQLIDFENQDQCKAWKAQLAQLMGGFDSKKHPIFIKTAAQNAAANFQKKENQITIGSTEVYELANRLLFILKSKIDLALKNMNL